MIARLRVLTVCATLVAGVALVALPDISEGATPVPPGPPVAGLPFENTSNTAPGGNTGGTGSAALNLNAGNSCNRGRPIAGAQWYTLPTGNLGTVYARVTSRTPASLSPIPQGLDARAAIVNYVTGNVLSCSGPTTINASQSTAVAVFYDAAELAACQATSSCGFAETTVSVRRTTGVVPTNDLQSSAQPITTLPYKDSRDTAFATASQSDPTALGTCNFGILPLHYGSVWWRYTATATGDLPVALASELLPSPGIGATPLSATVYEDTATGLQQVTGSTGAPCSEAPDSFPVVAGKTYYIEAFLYLDFFFSGTPKVTGGPATLTVGALRSPATPVLTATELTSATSTAVTLSWTPVPPGAPTTTPTTSYVLTSSTNGAAPASVTLPATTTSYTYLNVPIGTTTYTLTARNAAGAGAAATVVMTPGLPKAPSITGATINAAAATGTVTWTPVGTAPITGYRVSRSGTDSLGNGAVTSALLPATARTFTFGQLLPGQDYTFTVTPVNSRGAGPSATRQVSFPGVPTAPTDVAVTIDAATRTATVTWGLPVYAFPAVSGYRVSRNGTDSANTGPAATTVGPTTMSATFANLNPWEPYTFSVAAANGVGVGPVRTATASFTANVPARPTGVTVAPGRNRATVSWTAPTQTGGAAITGYRIRRWAASTNTLRGTTIVASTARSLLLTNVYSGSSYTFDVTAITANGFGAPSARTPEVRIP